ncbi:hypothetical protein Tco_1135608 [Tanacetum coccineum]
MRISMAKTSWRLQAPSHMSTHSLTSSGILQRVSWYFDAMNIAVMTCAKALIGCAFVRTLSSANFDVRWLPGTEEDLLLFASIISLLDISRMTSCHPPKKTLVQSFRPLTDPQSAFPKASTSHFLCSI